MTQQKQTQRFNIVILNEIDVNTYVNTENKRILNGI